MAPFTLRRHSSAPVEAVWAAAVDVGGHGDRVPLTRMRTDPPPMDLGWGFSGVTGAGPLRFADDMLVSEWEPPTRPGASGRYRVVKVGRWLSGWADVSVSPDEQGGSVLTWVEDVAPRPAPLGRLTSPVAERLGPRLFGRVVDGIIARAEGRDRPAESAEGDAGE